MSDQIKVDGEKEYLQGVAGFYGAIDENGGNTTVRSLTFYSNKGKYGPYGYEIGTAFNSPAKGKILGFRGSSGAFLDNIGVHIDYN